MKTIGYLRVSTSKQDADSQRLAILDYANKNGLKIDEWIEVEVSSRKGFEARRINELCEKLNEGDTLILSELSRLARSMPQVISLVYGLIQSKRNIVAVKENLKLTDPLDMTGKVMIGLLSLFVELERDLISLRTKEGLASRKAAGVKLGKPKGLIQKSKLDVHLDEIKNLLHHRVPKTAISRLMKTSRSNLETYLTKRGIS